MATTRGMIESGSDYHWAEGYSATSESGGVLYPWMTKMECCREAKEQGCSAAFCREPGSEACDYHGRRGAL